MLATELMQPASIAPEDDGPHSPFAIVHKRKLRNLHLGICFVPFDEIGDVVSIHANGAKSHEDRFPDGGWGVICGRGSLCAFEFLTPRPKLEFPATWRVERPGATVHVYRDAGHVSEGDPLPGVHGNLRILRTIPLPGVIHRPSGEVWRWGTCNPWTDELPARVPQATWRALPKKKSIPFRPSGYRN